MKEMKTMYRRAWAHIGRGLKQLIWSIGVTIATHIVADVLVISIAANIFLLVTHLQDAYGRETQSAIMWQLTQENDSLRMADVRYMR